MFHHDGFFCSNTSQYAPLQHPVFALSEREGYHLSKVCAWFCGHSDLLTYRKSGIDESVKVLLTIFVSRFKHADIVGWSIANTSLRTC